MKRIQNAKYDAVAPEDIVAPQENERRGTPDLTQKVNGTIWWNAGAWKGSALSIELKEGTKP